ncbi:MAG: CocE/NonD family hydrolase, partial [Kiloniellales bacterium]|nr:CocE/NonD family hydrolase [Kiloniellales bacterium]
LKAIISLCSTDDRYADDAHYMGGCLLNENMQWGSILTLYGAFPPDPEIVGDRWREMWAERLDALQPFPAHWMRHAARDDYWKHGSVCENYDAIKVPVYAIGGWADGYANAIPRLLENLSCPKKGLIGPWAHNFPHDARPGPSIGFLQEAIRWWDRWLKGNENGIMSEPLMRVWMQECIAPKPQYDEWPGRWVAEETWPSKRTDMLVYHLNPGHLAREADPSTELSFSSPQTTGLRAGEWCAFGADGEMPPDQRSDDGGSLIFDSDPLKERLEILGAPEVELEVSADRPVAQIAVRLCAVAPDGSSLRVSYGLLNLCHRDGHEQPENLEPGHWYRLSVRLNDCAMSLPPGYRLRLSLSTGYWPISWPSPEAVQLTLRSGKSVLTLPSRPERASDTKLRPFEEPEAAPGGSRRKLQHMPMRRVIEADLATNEIVYTLRGDGGEFDGAVLAHIEDINLDVGYFMMKRYRIIEDDPLSARTEMTLRAMLRRGEWSVRLICRTSLTGTTHNFQFSCDLEAFEGEKVFRERNWAQTIPRGYL